MRIDRDALLELGDWVHIAEGVTEIHAPISRDAREDNNGVDRLIETVCGVAFHLFYDTGEVIVKESSEKIFLFNVLDFNDDSLFLIFCKQVILGLDVSDCLRILIFGMNLVYVDRDAKDILSKLTEHRGLTENPFESCTIFKGNDFNHLVYPFFRTEDRMLRYKR
jgi:hypothetical protein